MSASSFYDDVWQRFSDLDAKSPAAFHRRRLIRKLALEFAPRAVSVLDAGCGQGELLSELERALPGARISGADVSSESRRQAKKRCPGADVFELDLQASDFESAQREHFDRFDLVVCSEVLEHLPDDALAVSRLKQLLLPSGVLIVTVPGGKKSRFDELIGHQRHYRKRELSSLLTMQGLHSELLWAWGFPFHNAYRTAVRLASRFAFKQPKQESKSSTGSPLLPWLARAYTLCGRALLPLYYANRPYWGEQLVAVVRRP